MRAAVVLDGESSWGLPTLLILMGEVMAKGIPLAKVYQDGMGEVRNCSEITGILGLGQP